MLYLGKVYSAMDQSRIDIWEYPTVQQLSQTMAAIGSAPVMQRFLRDIMTEKEILEISARLEAARLLQQGARYREVIKQTNLSSRTVARISAWLQNGYGGYKAALRITHHQRSKKPRLRAA
jgi:TrpR-related protein YerC/YecD